MLHAFPRMFRLGDRPPTLAEAATALPPLTPDAYIQLRRKAAGVSLEQVAARLSRAIGAGTIECLELIRQLEKPRFKARHRTTLEALRAIFPLDPDVYHQLATEPAERHPRVCRTCGCSQWDACDENGHGCAWSTPGLCTRCDGAKTGGTRQ